MKFEDLNLKLHTPVLTYCRQLIEEGTDPNTRLELYRERPEPDLIVKNIGDGAKLGVSEEVGCVFRKYNKPVGGLQ